MGPLSIKFNKWSPKVNSKHLEALVVTLVDSDLVNNACQRTEVVDRWSLNLYEGCHTLNILNLFFLGFDTDVAFEAQVGPVGQEND